MKILDRIAADEEISQLKKELEKKTGQSLGFNYDCYTGIEDYKEHLRMCVKEGKIIARPQDEEARNRFASVIKK